LSLDDQGIVNLIDGYERETRAIKEEALRTSWFMRGGVTYNEAMALGYQERELVNKIIKENIENTKKSRMPLL
jgi:hypothetical protein